MTKRLPLLMLITCAAATAACGTTTRAQAPQDQPTLVVPPVPPRTIEPAPPTEPATIEAVPDLPTPPASLPRPRPTPGRNAESKPDTNKPEIPDPAATQPAAPTQPVPPLRTQAGPEGPEAAKLIRDTIARVNQTLTSVDYQKLSNDRRANYEAAKDFIKQAEDSITKDDLVLAKSLADRADTIAKQLAGR